MNYNVISSRGLIVLFLICIFSTRLWAVDVAGSAGDVYAAANEAIAGSDVYSSVSIGNTEVDDLVKAPTVEVQAPVAWQGKLPLIAFSPDEIPRILQLRQAEAQYVLLVPVPYRVEAESIEIHLEFTNSTALLRGRSQIRLRWNGSVVAQGALDPEFPGGEMKATIPLDVVHGGDNTLSLEVSQHYLAECEDPGSPELWTTIDMESSYILISGHLKDVPAKLTELDHWLSPVNWGEQRLTIASLGQSTDHWHAGTAIAQGIGSKTKNALLIDAIPDLQSLQSLPAHQDVVLFGLYDEAMAIPGLLTEKPSALGRITFLPRQGDRGHFMLMILTETTENLIKVSNALAWSSLPLQATASMDIQEIEEPQDSPYSARKATMGGRSYTFADLDYQTRTLKGLHDHVRVQMWLPPDLFAKNHSSVDLKLHFSYGAALRPDSVMNIYHNGIFLQSMSLGDPNGLQVNDYLISVPMYSFRPGLNEFIFESRMHANTGSNCTTGNTDNLLMTLYDDSTISIPDAPNYVAMPNLYFSMNTGFPYLGNNGDTPVIQVQSMDADAISTAWTLAAKIGQLKGSPVQSLTVTTNAESHADVIRLVSLQDVNKELWQKTPVDLSEVGLINHPTLKDPNVLGEKTQSKFEELYKLFWWDDREQNRPGFHTTNIRHSVQILDNSGIMMQLENPNHESGTLTLILADGDTQLRHAVEDLVTLWPKLHDIQGDVLFWGKEGTANELDYNALDLDPHQYHIGEITLLNKLTYYAIQYPLFLLGVMLGLLIILSLLTRWVLVSHRRENHPNIES